MENSSILYSSFVLKTRFTEFFKKIIISVPDTVPYKNILRVPVSIDNMWLFDPLLAKNLLENPFFCLPIIENVFKELFSNLKNFTCDQKILIIPNIEGSFENRICTPKTLKAHFIGEIVCVKGTIMRCTNVKIRIERSVHFSFSTGKFFVKEFKNLSDNSWYYNFNDINGKYLDTEYGLCKFNNWQSIVLKDFPVHLSFDYSSSRSITGILEKDLINTCKVGDQVELCGIYSPLSLSKTNLESGFFFPILSILSIKNINLNLEKDISTFDKYLMKKFSLLVNSFDKLALLIAPQILNQKFIKKGILLFLIGGNKNKKEKIFSIQNEMNILIVGEPLTAKTEFIRFILKFCPSSIFFKGNLFPKFNFDFQTQSNLIFEKNYLENNEIIFFDKKIICIDQFEKITEMGKTVLKEILEQQTISVEKNGFSISLNARCNIFATGNSLTIFKNFFKKKKNSQIPATILSRFDLIFFLSENFSFKKEKQIADFVLKIHRNYYVDSFLKFNKKKLPKKFSLMENFILKKKKKKFENQKFPFYFLKIFINFSKKNIDPIFSNEGNNAVLKCYKNLKKIQIQKKLTNIKQIETIIKLSKAYAKCHLRSIILEKDVVFVFKFSRKLYKLRKGDNKESCEISKDFFFSNNYRNFKPENKYPKFLKIENKNKNKWIIKIKKKRFFNKNFKEIKIYKINFFNMKKLIILEKKLILTEKILSNWLEKKICFIFENSIIKF